MNNISKETWYSTIESMLNDYSTDTVRLYMTKTWKQVLDLSKNEYSMARKKYLSKYKRVKLNITKETVKELIENINSQNFNATYFVLNLMFVNPDIDYVRMLQKHTHKIIIDRTLNTIDKNINITKFISLTYNFKDEFIQDPYASKEIFIQSRTEGVYSKQHCYDILKQFDFKLQDTKHFYIKYILPNYPSEEFKEYNKYYLQELINICKNI